MALFTYSSSPILKVVQQELLQFLLLITIVLTACLAIFSDVMLLDHGIGEHSLTEFYQQILLFLVVCCFAYVFKVDHSERHFHLLVIGFFTCMLIREFDAFFDELVVHGFWVYPALGVFIVCTTYALQDKQGTLAGIVHFTQNRYFQGISTALVIILVFSRLFGMGELWETILADNYVRLAKNTVEEGVELLGYSLLFYNAFGYARRIKRNSKSAN
ncbi:hypothetical protein HWV00_04835 [Moritella sp. 24]|uniref:hypothetical protein n=1 Tax=Moritella sp. 24 TaxID=2746230 RepID=UPI001BA68E3D|nr:hypothetical protein [Moritella sp. 24]QUM75613.1 hypothetical protein HWV00_04835 [Moritella sp. 24]